MRSCRPLAVLAALLAALIASADTKAELDGMYQRFNTAVKQKNLQAAMALCTKDFTWVDSKGTKMTRAQMEGQLKQQFAMFQQITSVTVKIDKITVKGAEVVAQTQGVFEATVKMSPDAKTASKLKSVSKTDDTWVKVAGKWLLKKVTAIKEETTVDGKRISG